MRSPVVEKEPFPECQNPRDRIVQKLHHDRGRMKRAHVRKALITQSELTMSLWSVIWILRPADSMICPAVSLRAPRKSGFLFNNSFAVAPRHQNVVAEHGPAPRVQNPAAVRKRVVLPPATKLARNVVQHESHALGEMLYGNHAARANSGSEQNFKHVQGTGGGGGGAAGVFSLLARSGNARSPQSAPPSSSQATVLQWLVA